MKVLCCSLIIVILVWEKKHENGLYSHGYDYTGLSLLSVESQIEHFSHVKIFKKVEAAVL